MTFLIEQAAEWMRGVLHGAAGVCNGVSIDTRTIKPGDLFFALRGPNFDGHDYVGKAFKAGASAAVVETLTNKDGPQLVVDDARLALGRFGRAWRQQFDVLTVGVTGSNGKTTLKEMIASILSVRGNTLATAGNLNNDLGVPLMLSRLRDEHEFAVIEMGANARGEIAYLTSLVEPDIVLLGNAGPAHLEGFGGIEGVAEGKGEILRGTPRPRCAVLNRDDAYYDYWRAFVDDIDKLTFGLSEDADIRATDIDGDLDGNRFTLHTDTGAIRIDCPLAGEHNVKNACAAAAVARAADIGNSDIATGLAAVAPVGGRRAAVGGVSGCQLFDDSYNANPGSVTAAGRFLGNLVGKTFFVLGDMFELGKDETAIHEEVGVSLKQAGVDELHATGELCRFAVSGFGAGASWYASKDALIDGLVPRLDAGSYVLVKGSRSMRMEQVVEKLRVEEAA
ncbi:MAG: UDP-N-acetylmuramoyl-tripeptide--D-alanyl-D-alanine ligase [Pseudomonadota bacterium]